MKIVLDVKDESQMSAAATTVAREIGRLDILVNNAGTNVEECTPREGKREQ